MKTTIDMVREAGMLVNTSRDSMDHLERLVALVRADERETLLEIVYSYSNNLSWNDDFQDAIRERGNT